MASTWAFPNPTHAYAYQEMLGFLERGVTVAVLLGERRPAADLAARFRPLLDRLVIVETVRQIHDQDLAALDREHPGRVDAFLQKVADELGRSVGDLRADPLVLRACTFTRLVELIRPRYLQSWFFYDQSFMTMFASQVLGIPRGISCHVDHELDDFAFKLVRLQLETADLVLAISERTKAELVARGSAGCSAKILVKRIGVDGAVFRQLRGQRPVNGAFELVSICRLEPKKGLLELADAIGLLREHGREVVVRLIGGVDPLHRESAAYAAELEARLVALHLTDVVVLDGAVPGDEIAIHLATAHAFLAPYVEVAGGDKDGIPTSMVEAMAAGVPIVCTDAGAMREAVTDGVEGLVVAQRDPAAFAAAIERLMDDDALRQRCGAAAAERFDREFDCRVTDAALHARVRELTSAREQ